MLRTTPITDWHLVTADTAWHLRLCILRGEIVRVADRIRYRTGTGP